MGDMKRHIDTEYMISIIEKHPCIWDRDDESYRNLAYTSVAWKNIYIAVHPNYDDLEVEEKNRFAQAVMNRWKNVRDAWMKAQRRMSNDKLTGKGRVPKKYIFEDQLSFLRKSQYSNAAGGGGSGESEAGSDMEHLSDISVTIAHDLGEPEDDPQDKTFVPSSSSSTKPTANSTSRPTRKRKQNEFNESLCYEGSPAPILKKTPSPLDVENENRHMLFFRSLMPSLVELKEEQVLQFQVGVLQLMQSVKKSGESSAEDQCDWKIETNSP